MLFKYYFFLIQCFVPTSFAIFHLDECSLHTRLSGTARMDVVLFKE